MEGDELLLLLIAASSRSSDSEHIHKATDSVQGFEATLAMDRTVAGNGSAVVAHCGGKQFRARYSFLVPMSH